MTSQKALGRAGKGQVARITPKDLKVAPGGANSLKRPIPAKGWRAVGQGQALKKPLRVIPVRQKVDKNVMGPAWWVGLDRQAFNESIKERFPKIQPSYGRRDV